MDLKPSGGLGVIFGRIVEFLEFISEGGQDGFGNSLVITFCYRIAFKRE
jgi:hypothetical protein